MQESGESLSLKHSPKHTENLAKQSDLKHGCCAQLAWIVHQIISKECDPRTEDTAPRWKYLSLPESQDDLQCRMKQNSTSTSGWAESRRTYSQQPCSLHWNGTPEAGCLRTEKDAEGWNIQEHGSSILLSFWCRLCAASHRNVEEHTGSIGNENSPWEWGLVHPVRSSIKVQC